MDYNMSDPLYIDVSIPIDVIKWGNTKEAAFSITHIDEILALLDTNNPKNINLIGFLKLMKKEIQDSKL